MYEAHFGISGPPFQLSPDPAFYFDSRGHHEALALLRSALAAPNGFVVVSGEIGAGKTTLVRTLLAELEPVQIFVAQIVSTQLEVADFVQAVCIAFGVTRTAQDSHTTEALEGRLRQIALDGSRCLLFVDEAQNLHTESLLLLAEIERRTEQAGVPLTVCLVGQPELRGMVESGDLLALAARVRATYHLSPLDEAETGAYVMHRLAKVGWSGAPRFAMDAFVQIHRWSHGVPRRINQLCNRLLLACFLTGVADIDAASVARISADMDAEIGGKPLRERLGAFEGGATPPITAQPPAVKRDPPTLGGVMLQGDARPLLLVAGSQADHLQAAALLRAIAARGDLPVCLLVRAFANNAFDRNRDMFAGLDTDGRIVSLGIAGGTYAGRAAELMQRFEFVVDRCLPAAVVVFDGSDAALSCGLVASRRAIPVVQVGAGLRVRGQPGAADITRKLTDQLSEVLYVSEVEAGERLVQEGSVRERIVFVGNLQVDALQIALRSSIAGGPRERLGLPSEYLSDRNGYGVVALDASANVNDRQILSDLVGILRDTSRDVPLVWPMHTHTREQLVKFKLDATLRDERIACLAEQGYVSFVQLLANATCVLTDSWHVQEEATALGLPCLALGVESERPITSIIGSTVAVGRNKAVATRTVWDCIFNGGKRGAVPDHWDGRAGARIAEHLALWIRTAQQRTESAARLTSGS